MKRLACQVALTLPILMTLRTFPSSETTWFEGACMTFTASLLAGCAIDLWRK